MSGNKIIMKNILIILIIFLLFIFQQDNDFFNSERGETWLLLDSEIIIRDKPIIPYNLGQWNKNTGIINSGTKVTIIDTVGRIDKWKKIYYKERDYPFDIKFGWIFASSINNAKLESYWKFPY